MYVRRVSFSGANIDVAQKFVRERAIPLLKAREGFRGVGLSANRSSAEFDVTTLWATEADMNAGANFMAGAREGSAPTIGSTPTRESFERVVLEIGEHPPVPGCLLRLQRVSIDPSSAGDAFARFCSEEIQAIKASPGFAAVTGLVNRETGNGLVGTVWLDEASMRAEDAKALSRRSAGGACGVQFSSVSYREVLFVEIG